MGTTCRRAVFYPTTVSCLILCRFLLYLLIFTNFCHVPLAYGKVVSSSAEFQWGKTLQTDRPALNKKLSTRSTRRSNITLLDTFMETSYLIGEAALKGPVHFYRRMASTSSSSARPNSHSDSFWNTFIVQDQQRRSIYSSENYESVIAEHQQRVDAYNIRPLSSLSSSSSSSSSSFSPASAAQAISYSYPFLPTYRLSIPVYPDANNLKYTMKLYIGSQRQPLELLIDTCFSDIFILSNNSCYDLFAHSTPCFDDASSATLFTENELSPVQFLPYDGEIIRDDFTNLYYDFLGIPTRISGLKSIEWINSSSIPPPFSNPVGNIQFLLSTSIEIISSGVQIPLLNTYDTIDGAIGMGYNTLALDNAASEYSNSAKSAFLQMISYALSLKDLVAYTPILSWDFSPESVQDYINPDDLGYYLNNSSPTDQYSICPLTTSYVYVGGIDERYRNFLIYSDSYVNDPYYRKFPTFSIYSFRMCDIEFMPNTFAPWPARINSGATCLSLPAEVFDALVSWLPADCTLPDDEDEMPQVSCWLPDGVPINLPTISFKITANGPDLHLNLSDLVISYPPSDFNAYFDFNLPFFSRHLCLNRGFAFEFGARYTPFEFGSRVLRSLYVVSAMNLNVVGLADKLPAWLGAPPDINTTIPAAQVSNVMCLPRRQCIGMQYGTAEQNVCIDPSCSDYIFFGFDEIQKRCYLDGTFFIMAGILVGIYIFSEMFLNEIHVYLCAKVDNTYAPNYV